jgi:hypothetical protein
VVRNKLGQIGLLGLFFLLLNACRSGRQSRGHCGRSCGHS